jgi:hypothetical protein
VLLAILQEESSCGWVDAEGGTRTPTSCLTRPSNVRVYQFRHFGSKSLSVIRAGYKLPETLCQRQIGGDYFCAGAAGAVFVGVVGVAGAAAFALAAGAAAFVFAGASPGASGAAGLAAGVACGCAGCSPCNTEREPVTKGIESARPKSINAAAAPMVIFASKVCVPRGPNAALETLLEKSAPASALPGCNSTDTIITMHARINSVYKT